MPFDTFPPGTLLFAKSVVTVTGGGTAGGNFPTYATGASFGASAGTALRVALYDLHGTLIDFVAKGTVVVSSLQDSLGQSAGVTTSDWSGTISSSPSTASRVNSNDTNLATDWSTTSGATLGSYNAGLPSPGLEFLSGGLPVGRAGALYSKKISAAGGFPPYSFYLMTTSTPWLSLNTGSGELSGFLPSGAAGTYQVTIRVTDSTSAWIEQATTLSVASSTTVANHHVVVGNAVGSTAGGTSLTLPIQISSASPEISELEFTLTIFDPSLQFTGLESGQAAVDAGASVVAWRPVSANSIVVLCRGFASNAASLASGDIAILSLRVVPATGNSANPGTQAVTISQVSARNLLGSAILTEGVAGSTTLSQFSPSDVNRDSYVDVIDVQLTVNIILSTASPSYPGQGDSNGDSSIDVVDIQNIVNCILAIGPCN
jgi:hypothetical protein